MKFIITKIEIRLIIINDLRHLKHPAYLTAVVSLNKVLKLKSLYKIQIIFYSFICLKVEWSGKYQYDHH